MYEFRKKVGLCPPNEYPEKMKFGSLKNFLVRQFLQNVYGLASMFLRNMDFNY